MSTLSPNTCSRNTMRVTGETLPPLDCVPFRESAATAPAHDINVCGADEVVAPLNLFSFDRKWENALRRACGGTVIALDADLVRPSPGDHVNMLLESRA